MYTILVGILFMTTIIQGRSLAYDSEDEGDFEYLPLSRARSISSNQFKARKVLDKELLNSMDLRDLFDFYEVLKHNTRSFTQFQEESLQAHNEYRACHGAEPLVLDDELTKSAQNYSDYLATSGKWQHSGQKGVGENIYQKSGSSPVVVNATRVVEGWYSEHANYDYISGTAKNSTKPIGHFTQVVWKDSKELGIAKAVCKDGSTYVVANYEPAGNYLGQFEQNVLRPK